jgi:Flp pilus assembly protein TadG
MFREIQPVHSFRKCRRRSRQEQRRTGVAPVQPGADARPSYEQAAGRFALGWRSASGAAIYALQSATALAAEAIRANCAFPQILAKKQKTSGISKDERSDASRPLPQCFCLLRQTEAAAIIEFAVALPLLIVLVVGIFDFGGAFNMKQELNNAAREGARFGAAQPTNDLSNPNLKPPSVDAIRFLVDSYLQTAHINDCGLSAIPEPPQGGGFAWVYNASTGCPGSRALTLTISRAVVVQVTIGGATVNMLCTTVNISYPYQWHFNNVIQLLVPGANYTLGNIQSNATAVNMN